MLTSQDVAEMHFENRPKSGYPQCRFVEGQGMTVTEDPMVAFYRRDNEELRKYLTAERIENNRLRATVSDLASGVGVAIGFIRALPVDGAENVDVCNTTIHDLQGVLDRMTALAK